MTWTAYALWRFAGVRPLHAILGPSAPEPTFPEREEALVVAFAENAAIQEGMVRDAIEAFGSASKRP